MLAKTAKKEISRPRLTRISAQQHQSGKRHLKNWRTCNVNWAVSTMHHNHLEILDSIGSNISVSNGSKVSTTIETIYCNASHQNESGMITSQNCLWAAGVEQQVGKWNDLPWTTGTHNPRHHDLFEANETHDASCVAEEWGHSTARPCHRHRLLFGRRMSCLGFGTSLTRKKKEGITWFSSDLVP